VFLETAHPAKFLEVVENTLNEQVKTPEKLKEFLMGNKKSFQCLNQTDALKELLKKLL
jgi:threonine synthase